MAVAITFQDLIQRLNAFWAAQGCVLIQPLDLEVGAGTFHPATFLRALGPEPWNAAYVQPSRRPTDGRYGENPNRLQHYYQFQVIMKPSPINILDLYLDSLRAFGLDPSSDQALGGALILVLAEPVLAAELAVLFFRVLRDDEGS